MEVFRMDAGVWFRTLRDLPAPLALPTPAGQTSSSRSSREKRIDGFYASGVCVVCGGRGGEVVCEACAKKEEQIEAQQARLCVMDAELVKTRRVAREKVTMRTDGEA